MTTDRTEHIRAALRAMPVTDQRADISRHAILTMLDVLGDPFAESHPTHVTASAIVITDGGVLLHLHKRLGIWTGPGGHVDGTELPEDAVVRETLEETGILARHPDGVPQMFHVDVHPSAKGHIHLDLRYLLRADPATPKPPEGESQEVAWVPMAEAKARTDVVYANALRVAESLTRAGLR